MLGRRYETKKTIKKQLENAEERAGFHFTKLWKIDRLINEYEKKNGNPYMLIRDIKNVLDTTLKESSTR